MTRNQIEYAKLLEARRANQQQESIKAEQVRKDYDLGIRNLQELSRHNVQTESLSLGNLDELSRHNRQSELLSLYQAQELERYHTRQIEHYQEQLSEQRRSNIVRESETKRANLAQEQELKRYHVASLDEQTRSNIARETQLRNELAELIRSHNLNFDVETAKLQEQSRANLAREAETNRSNVAHENELTRSNFARETETNRANLRSEELRDFAEQETKRHNLVTEVEKGVGIVMDNTTGKFKNSPSSEDTTPSRSRNGQSSFGTKRSGSFGSASSSSNSNSLIPSITTGGNWSVTLGGGFKIGN